MQTRLVSQNVTLTGGRFSDARSGLVSAAALWCLLSSNGCYSVQQYRGDGTATNVDSAFCKYAFELPAVSTQANEPMEFHFEGLPNATLSVCLVLLDKDDERILSERGVSCALQLTEVDRSGKRSTLISVDGPLVNERGPMAQWLGGSPFLLPPSVWPPGQDRAAYESKRQEAWVYSTWWVRTSREASYTMRVSFESLPHEEHEESVENVELIPLLWGGGFLQPKGLAGEQEPKAA